MAAVANTIFENHLFNYIVLSLILVNLIALYYVLEYKRGFTKYRSISDGLKEKLEAAYNKNLAKKDGEIKELKNELKTSEEARNKMEKHRDQLLEDLEIKNEELQKKNTELADLQKEKEDIYIEYYRESANYEPS